MNTKCSRAAHTASTAGADHALCVGVSLVKQYAHPAEAGPLAGDKRPRHRVAAGAVAIVQPAVRDVQGAALQPRRLQVNEVDLSAECVMAAQCTGRHAASCSCRHAPHLDIQSQEAAQLSPGRCSKCCLLLDTVFARLLDDACVVSMEFSAYPHQQGGAP